MILPPPKVCQRIFNLHALLGSSSESEAGNARAQLVKLLGKHGLTWNDLPEILPVANGEANNKASTHTAATQAATEAPTINVLDLMLTLIEEHVAITAEERLAVALWILHTYVSYRFAVTPRLALLSPVRECGKTSLIEMLELLVSEAYRTDNVTAAVIYNVLDCRPRTAMLLDEADNLGLLNNPVLRAVFNSGHRHGGSVDRFISGRPRKYATFAPLAVAAIGDALPLPLLGRSVIIRMQRYAPRTGQPQLKRIDTSDPVFLAAREEIRKWAAMCSLNPNPEMPSGFINRVADNWRVLFSIADDLGHGDEARAAARVLRSRRSDDDPGVVLLDNIRAIFVTRGIDRVFGSALVSALHEFEDGQWSEWQGLKSDRPPHKLTQPELAGLLRPFGIRPRTIYPIPRRPEDRSARGYLRSQFEAAWRVYCHAAETPAPPSKITYLRRE